MVLSELHEHLYQLEIIQDFTVTMSAPERFSSSHFQNPSVDDNGRLIQGLQ